MNKRFNLFVVQKRMPAVRRQAALGVLFAFLVNTILGPVSSAFAQAALPLPATMVNLSAGYSPTLIKGMRVYPENPLRFDFIVDAGDSGLQGSDLEEESSKLMKYFLSSLTVPEKDLWVNLSPYEKDRIIPDAFGKTEMGRDMLGQDYILKQLTSSLIYPESELGKSFWAMAYQKAYEAFGSTDIPVNTFNKIWIVPQKAVVFAKDNIAYVAETHLQVMLEEDYVALANQKDPTLAKAKDANAVGSQIVREIILPAIEKEVNEGRNFAPLRQVYNSLILATWYKRNLKESILGKVYIGQNKIDGVTFTGDTNKERIYQDYLEAFQKGVYNYIREEEDRFTQEMVPRKYFSGGVEFAQKIEEVFVQTADQRVVGGSAVVTSKQSLFAVELGRAKPAPVEVAAAGTSSAAFDFSVRDIVRTGAKPVLFSGRYDRGENGSLTSTGGIEDQARNFKQAVATVAEQSVNPLSTIKAMEPLVRYLLERTIKEKNYTEQDRKNLRWEELGLQNELAKNPTAELNVALEAVRLKIQKAVFIQKMSKVLDGRSYTTTEMQELLNIVATLINDLPDQEVLRLLAATQERVKNFLYVKSAKIADWNTVEVRLVLNGGDVFEIEKLDDGQAVLNVDFSSFVKSLSAAQVLSWDYNFSDSDFRQSQVADVEKFAQAPATKNVFIGQNAAVVAEVLRIMNYMENVVDRYFQIGLTAIPGSPEEAALAREKFLNQLRSDSRNTALVDLLEQLGEISTVRKDRNDKEIKVSDKLVRMDKVLQYVLGTQKLRARAAINSRYQKEDIAAMNKFYSTLKPQWFTYSVGKPVTEADVQQLAAEANQQQVEVIAAVNEAPPAVADQTPAQTAPVLADVLPAVDGRIGPAASNDSSWWDSLKPTRSTFRRLALVGAIFISAIASLFNQWSQNDNLAAATFLESGTIIVAQAETDDTLVAPVAYQRLSLEKKGTESVKYAYSSTDYTVVPGDTLSEIAERYGMKGMQYMKIFWANQSKLSSPHLLIPGTVLTIPDATLIAYPVKVDDTREAIAKDFYGAGMQSQWERIKDANQNILAKVGLRPGIVLNIPMSIAEFNARQSVSSINKQGAQSASSTLETVGGINLDPTGLEINTFGDNFKFDVPIDPQMLQNLQLEPVNGLVPVILNVVPIINLPQFLGVQKTVPTPKDSLAFAK